jgi:GT2 family glycosyltransferase
MVFRRQALEELGPPKLWLGPGSAGASADDAELVLRALLMGKTVLREPKLVVYHDRWLAPSAMKRQALIYTRGEAACYGYLAFQGHVFAWRVLKNGLLAKRHDFSQLLAYAKGLLAAGYFYLFDG